MSKISGNIFQLSFVKMCVTLQMREIDIGCLGLEYIMKRERQKRKREIDKGGVKTLTLMKTFHMIIKKFVDTFCSGICI